MVDIEEMTAFLKDLFDLMEKLNELIRYGKDLVYYEIGRTAQTMRETSTHKYVEIIEI